MINSNLLKSLVYNSKNTNINEVVQKRLYECVKHGISEIANIDYTSPNKNQIISSVNQTISEFYQDVNHQDRQPIFLGITSSTLYDFLLGCTVPSIEYSELQSNIYIATLTISDDADHFEKLQILSLLATLKFELDTQVVLHNDVYDFIQSSFSKLKLKKIKKIPFSFKKIPLDSIRNEYDVLSKTNQQKYKADAFSILSYQNEFSNDHQYLSTLQNHFIDQQVRIAIFSIIFPFLKFSEIQFTKSKNISDSQGNLFFNLTIFKSQKSLNFSDLFFSLLDYGILPSQENINQSIYFDTDLKKDENRTTLHNNILNNKNILKLNKSSYNSTLFRLLDDQLSNNVEDIDTSITSNDVNKILFELKKLS